MKGFIKYKMGMVLSLCLLILGMIPTQGAENTKVVRIGYIDYGSFIEEDKEGNYSGYGVEYLEEISKYTGWEYEYVYDTWENCLDMLENGEIDFLGTAQKTPEREQIFAFADIANGVEQTVVYTRLGNNEIYYNDYEAFDDKKVGLLIDSYQTEFFEKYAVEHNFTYKPIYMDTEAKMVTALKKGEIDMMVGGSLALHTDLKVVAKEGADPFYFMTYQGNEETLAQLNAAMEEIQSEHPYYSEELAKSYYGNSVITSQPQFTRQEAMYIEQAPVIKVGYLSDCYPISGWNEHLNAPEGIAIDLMNQIVGDIGLEIEYVRIPAGELPQDYLENGRIDLMIPATDVGYESSSELLLSDTILEENMAAVMRQEEIFDVKERYRIAFVNDNPSAEKIVKKNIDEYTPIYYDSLDACFQAVKDGDADVYFDNYYIAAYRLKSPFYAGLQENYGHVFTANYSISATKENAMLIRIVNKAISAMDENQVQDIIGIHTLSNNYEETFWEKCYANRIAISAVTILILFMIATFLNIMFMQRRNVREMEATNRELEKANQARQTFLSNMSHEIRTPLNGIKGSLDILTENTYDEKTTELLSMSSISANHLLNLVNDILDMAKIESGKIELHKEYVSKTEFFAYLDAIVAPLAKKKHLSIERYIPEDMLEYFYVDRNRLNQICINILSNSIKYTKENGRIIFTVKAVNVNTDEVKLSFTIEDNGIGMSHEFQERALEPFVQEMAVDEQTGTGLGLAITRNLVSLMDGTFAIESEPGVGTKVFFSFTTKAKDAEYKEKEQKSPRPKKDDLQREKHILIVEDNEINRKIATMQATAYGLLVDQVKNGQEAVTQFENSPVGFYDMILMDVMMPVMDGLEATKRIRRLEREDAKSVLIIAMTANAYVEDIHKSMKSGMNAHLSKPFNKDEIRNVFDLIP